MKIAVFWVVAPCSLVEVYQRFRGPYNPEDSNLQIRDGPLFKKKLKELLLKGCYYSVEGYINDDFTHTGT
jgi:hypothetical protein